MAHILIAEDEHDIRELITFTLQYAGHQVTSATNGEEAYESAVRLLPDLILLDVRMPRMTGYEVCEKIKSNEETQLIPVVFLSAKGQEAEVKTGLMAGAVEYIVKPFAPEQLVERVRTILASYRKA
jgi:two-component system alkaline phosphatase synthesis response regulator PhoP